MALGIVLVDSPALSIRITTTGSPTLHVSGSYVDDTGTTVTPAAITPATISTATTTTILAAPSAGTRRLLRQFSVRNANSSAVSTTVDLYDGTTARPLIPLALASGEVLTYEAGTGWEVRGTDGAPRPFAGVPYTGRAFQVFKVGTASEAAGIRYSFGKDSGTPGAWSPGTPGLNGRMTDGTTTTDAGAIPWTNPAAGRIATLDAVAAVSSVTGFLELVDVLWVNSGAVVTTTTAQAITSPTWPARDLTGGTTGLGLSVGILVTGATTNAGAITNTTLTYTSSDGTGSRTATIASFPATAVIGTVVPFQLAAGDRGLSSIQSVTLGTSYAGGSISLVVYRTIATIPVGTANVGGIALPTRGDGLVVGPRCYDGSCLLVWGLFSATTAPTVSVWGSVSERAA